VWDGLRAIEAGMNPVHHAAGLCGSDEVVRRLGIVCARYPRGDYGPLLKAMREAVEEASVTDPLRLSGRRYSDVVDLFARWAKNDKALAAETAAAVAHRPIDTEPHYLTDEQCRAARRRIAAMTAKSVATKRVEADR